MLEDLHFDTAREFIDALDPTRELWVANDGTESPWVFRGQRESNWPLVPSAWRTPGSELLAQLKPDLLQLARTLAIERHGDTNRIDEWRVSVLAETACEHEAVHQFARLADRLAMKLPGEIPDSGAEILRRYLGSQGSNNKIDLETPLTSEIAALAQHHGIPTRLLDFSYDPYKAAFFAVSNVSSPSDNRLAVCAMNIGGSGFLSKTWAYTCRRSENHYLHAQDGLFLCRRGGDKYRRRMKAWPNLEDPSRVRRVTLPHAEAAELRRLLWLRNVTLAHLMPTHDAVAKTLTANWAGGTTGIADLDRGLFDIRKDLVGRA